MLRGWALVKAVTTTNAPSFWLIVLGVSLKFPIVIGVFFCGWSHRRGATVDNKNLAVPKMESKHILKHLFQGVLGF